MIKITYKDLDKIIDIYYKNLLDYINQNNTKYNLDDISCDLIYTFDLDFEEIIKLTPNDMKNLIQKYKNIDTKNFQIFKDLYEVFRNKWAVWLIEELSIKVCPYCNREYIFKFEDTQKKEARIIASFDHFYKKETYPYLAISFYNLIPTCHICNSKFKHTKDFYKEEHIHPYLESLDKFAKFELSIKNSKFYYDIDGFDIEIQSNYKKAQNSINTFRLNDLYQNHKDIVLELIQKQIIYNESYIKELMRNYEGTLFKNEEDLMRFITCNYTNEDDIHKRPLSKLTKDISKELELI